MKLDDILQAAGKHKPRKRVGRGTGSGHGKTSGRGHKGWGQRTGSNAQLGFEGGQNPVIARMPKRGFSNAQFRTDYQVLNVEALERFEAGSRVDPAAMKQARLIADADKPVKILGNGALTRKLTVVAAKFSKTAVTKIADAGGTTEQV